MDSQQKCDQNLNIKLENFAVADRPPLTLVISIGRSPSPRRRPPYPFTKIHPLPAVLCHSSQITPSPFMSLFDNTTFLAKLLHSPPDNARTGKQPNSQLSAFNDSRYGCHWCLLHSLESLRQSAHNTTQPPLVFNIDGNPIANKKAKVFVNRFALNGREFLRPNQILQRSHSIR